MSTPEQIAARLDDGLRAGIEALADEWEGWSKQRTSPRIDAFRDAAEQLRTLLDQTRTEADR